MTILNLIESSKKGLENTVGKGDIALSQTSPGFYMSTVPVF